MLNSYSVIYFLNIFILIYIIFAILHIFCLYFVAIIQTHRAKLECLP